MASLIAGHGFTNLIYSAPDMPTVTHRFVENVRGYGHATAFLIKNGGVWSDLSWDRLFFEVGAVIGRLRSAGVKKGDFVAIMSATRYEWTVIDLAIVSLGAVTVPIYPTLSDDQIFYILNHSESRILFVENNLLLTKVGRIKSRLLRLENVLVIEDTAGAESYCQLTNSPAKFSIDEYVNIIAHLKPEDIATCVYTSGTTGEPKGALLTHGNIIGEIDGLRDVFDFSRDEIGLLFLPLAHVIARAMQFYQLSHGFITAYAGSIENLKEDLINVRPHFVLVVPRIMEKIYENIMGKVTASSSLKQYLFNRGVELGRTIGRNRRKKRETGFMKRARYSLMRRFLFSRIVRVMGGRIKFIVSGGAPLDKKLAEFFDAVDLLILEGYGLTETFAAITVNRPNDYKFGTIGKPLDGVQVRLAEDGELQAKGPQVFIGYKKPLPEDEVDPFEEGWFKTGDIAEYSRDGFLKITGRKKDIIITASGKNISPQRVENMLKKSRYIKDAVVFGDRQKYLGALVIPDIERVKEYADGEGIKYISSADLVSKALICSLIGSEIELQNKMLSRHETVKKFRIIDHDFSEEGGELTPTLKLKRKKIYTLYKDYIDRMFG